MRLFIKCRNLLDNYGYKVIGVEMHDCLHLKTAVTKVDEKTLLINPKWVENFHFKDFDWIDSRPIRAVCGKLFASKWPDHFPHSISKNTRKT